MIFLLSFFIVVVFHMCENKIIIASNWIVGDDYHAERIVLCQREDKDGNIFAYSTHRQIERADKENWNKPVRPNLAYGDYFDYLGNKLNQEILDKFNERRFEFFRVRKDKWSIDKEGNLRELAFG